MKFLSPIIWPLRMVTAILLQPDKVSHFYWGASIGLVGLWMSWWGIVVVVAMAAAKELYDLFHPPHQSDWWDFSATTLGGVCAIGVIHLHARFS